MSNETTVTSRRITVRLASAQATIIHIRLAAALAGQTVVSFVWTAVDQRTKELVAEGHHLIMSKEASRALRRAPN
jgi:uncharacterized protein (DUF1778 family)